MNPFDAESAVVGGCLVDPEAYWRIADLLDAADFSRPELGEMWEAISELARKGAIPDAVTFGDCCPKHAVLAVQCANATPGASNIRAHAEVVQRNAITRRVRAAGQRLTKLAGDDVLGEAQRIIATCAPKMASAVKPAKAYLTESVALMTQRCYATEVLTGVPTSIEWLDENLSGWQRGDLIIVAARPSVGKTALAMQASLHAAQAGHPVLFLSLEMAGHQLTDRMLAHLSRVDMQAIRQPKQIDESQWPRISKAGEIIGGLPLLIDDTSALTVDAIEARVRQANASQRLGLVVIDYLTQITPPKAQSTNDAVQYITRRLKALAKDLRVPLVLLSQLNRAGDHEPTLVSLRDSGAIEQDADVVILLHRPDAAQRELIKCKVAKQRNGPTGDCYLHLDGASQRFTITDERPAEKIPAPARRGMRSISYLERSAQA